MFLAYFLVKAAFIADAYRVDGPAWICLIGSCWDWLVVRDKPSCWETNC
jgi:hypothetical protein